MGIEACATRAQALRGREVVADSRSARVEYTLGEPAVLWFPAGEVTAADAGRAGAGELAGFVSFDPAEFTIQLLDTVDAADERATVVKRFPNWGDTAHLVDIMDVRPTDEPGRYVSVVRDDGYRPVVEASQMLGQCIVAAMRQTGGRRVVSSMFTSMRVADATIPLTFVLTELTSGRTFTTIDAKVEQNGRAVATATLLCDVVADDIMRHEAPMPQVPGPYECPTFDMGVTGRDLRVVEGAYDGDPGHAVGPPVIDVWVRFREVPDDPALHAGLLAQFAGHMSIAAAMRPHAGIGFNEAHITLSTAVNTITFAFHREVRVDQWVLYHHLATFAGYGMTHTECRAYDPEGRLLASFTNDCMVRGFPGGATGDFKRSM